MYIKRLLIRFKLLCAVALMVMSVAGSQMVHAQVPQMINYQGKIEMSGAAFNGAGYFKFTLIDDPSSPTTNYWTNDGSSITAGAEPTAAITLPVSLGLFSLKLGDTGLTNMVVLPDTIFSNSSVYLRVWFSSDGVAFEQLNPDRQLVSVPFAMRAEKANSIDGTDVITTTEITNNTITDADINASAAISASKVDTSAATNLVSKITAGAGITLSPVSGVGDVTVSVTGGGVASDVSCTDCVESTDITDGTITTTDLSFDTATQAELDTHKSSTDHDGRYYTETELNTSDGDDPNTGSNKVHWNNLTGVPAGFVDGVDNGGSVSQLSDLSDVQSAVASSGNLLVANGISYGGVAMSGDVTINGGGATVVADNSHNHTTTTISGLDISDDTNLAAGTNITLSGDTLNVDDAFLSNSGDVGTGVFDFGGATSVEIPNAAAPVLSADGQMALETDADAINIQAGSASVGGIPANTDVALPLIQQKGITLIEPDQIQLISDAIPFFTVDSYNYPSGITITAIRLATSEVASMAVNVEEWVDPTDGAPVTLDNIATSASTEQTETTITDAVVAAGSYVFLDLDTTNVNWAKLTVWYYVND